MHNWCTLRAYSLIILFLIICCSLSSKEVTMGMLYIFLIDSILILVPCQFMVCMFVSNLYKHCRIILYSFMRLVRKSKLLTRRYRWELETKLKFSNSIFRSYFYSLFYIIGRAGPTSIPCEGKFNLLQKFPHFHTWLILYFTKFIIYKKNLFSHASEA